MKALLSIELQDLTSLHQLPGFPFVRRLTENDLQAFVPYLKAPGFFTTVPNTRLLEVHGLVVTAPVETCWMFNGQNDGVIPLNPDGVIALWDVVLDDGEEVNVMVLNPGAADAPVTGYAVGPATEDAVTTGGYGSGPPLPAFGDA
ncbi:MAG TPA: hypothetical protein VLU24_08170 [Mycobacterium sp.]|nr:hypothetical protein [Mycobacterium sp.]